MSYGLCSINYYCLSVKECILQLRFVICDLEKSFQSRERTVWMSYFINRWSVSNNDCDVVSLINHKNQGKPRRKISDSTFSKLPYVSPPSRVWWENGHYIPCCCFFIEFGDLMPRMERHRNKNHAATPNMMLDVALRFGMDFFNAPFSRREKMPSSPNYRDSASWFAIATVMFSFCCIACSCLLPPGCRIKGADLRWLDM